MAMSKVPEDEARAALAAGGLCPGAEPWRAQGKGGTGLECGAGLVDAHGAPLGLEVALLVSQGRVTKLLRFQFSIFRASQWGPERLYQLSIDCYKRLPNDQHAWPHEHIGTHRSDPQPGWAAWDFETTLAHFQKTTNVHFDTRITDPFGLDFDLK